MQSCLQVRRTEGHYLSWSRPMVRAALKLFFPLPMVEDPEEIQSSGRLSVWYLFSTCRGEGRRRIRMSKEIARRQSQKTG